MCLPAASKREVAQILVTAGHYCRLIHILRGLILGDCYKGNSSDVFRSVHVVFAVAIFVIVDIIALSAVREYCTEVAPLISTIQLCHSQLCTQQFQHLWQSPPRHRWLLAPRHLWSIYDARASVCLVVAAVKAPYKIFTLQARQLANRLLQRMKQTRRKCTGRRTLQNRRLMRHRSSQLAQFIDNS